jgi:formate dehydrogenase maturation protein FdhE
MQIDKLTERQVEILDTMWTIDEFEEVEAYIATLSEAEQVEARNLIRLVVLEGFDEIMAQQTEFPEAAAVLDKYRL